MQFIDETEIKEEAICSHANNPRSLKLSDNCLLSDKGNLKEIDKMTFRHNICNESKFNFDSRINVSDNCTKNPKSCERDYVKNNEDDCDSFIELKVHSTQRVTPKNGMYLGQRKFSSSMILADMLN